MSIPTNTGFYDYLGHFIVPANTGTWDDLSGYAWDNVKHWITKPSTDNRWIVDTIDLGKVTYFNLNIETQVTNGIITYDIYASDTGVFGGEETHTAIGATDTNIAAFYGQYVRVAVNSQGTGGLHTIDDIQIKVKTLTYTLSLTNVNTSTLSGTVSARQIAPGRNVSHIWAMNIKPQPLSHDLDVYVTDHKASTTLIPQIVSKDRTTPTFKLIGLDNVARDAVVDIELIVMGEQRMLNGNLITV